MHDPALHLLASSLGIGRGAAELVLEAERQLAPVFERIQHVALHNQLKVLCAMQDASVGQRHFSPSTGYGYDDIGRDALACVFAQAFGCEDALVRPQFASGTHAIATMIAGLLEAGDEMLCVTGKPYDTLQPMLGISGDFPHALPRLGITYRQIELSAQGTLDTQAVCNAIQSHTRMIYLQRSRGYAWRDAVSLEDMRQTFAAIRACQSDVIIAVDNCYGEFVALEEPADAGADIIAGSLIKNPGGGLAPTGGYIAGKRGLVERIAQRMTAPGIGREVGSYAASYAPYFQGIFMAPHIVGESLHTAALFAKTFEMLGMQTHPHSGAARSDIVQAVMLESPERLRAFCRSVQRCAPVDSFAAPEPWDMPGYDSKVIMAAGTFVQGASIELSADGPMKPPYIAYLQGGLTREHGKLAVMTAVEDLKIVVRD